MKSFLKIVLLSLFVLIIIDTTLYWTDNKINPLSFNYNLKSEEELIIYDFFDTNEHGALKLSQNVINETNQYMQSDSVYFSDILNYEGINKILFDFKNLLAASNKPDSFKEEEEYSEFERAFFNSLENPQDSSKILYHFLKQPFNSFGYRGIDTSYTSNINKPKIMLVGDSFVWGMSADPIYNNFTDLLLARGYLVYSFGIPGIDPAEYWGFVKSYTKILNPDLVMVCFFPGNDFMPFIRTLKEGEPHETLTNIGGFIYHYPFGEYIDLDSALVLYRNLESIPQEDSFFNKLADKSSVASLVWAIFYKLGWVKHELRNSYEKIHNASFEERIGFTRYYLQKIGDYLTDSEVNFVFTIVPEKPFKEQKDVEGYPLEEIFHPYNYYYPIGFLREEYEKQGGHFNNLGAKRYADFLEELILEKTHGY